MLAVGAPNFDEDDVTGAVFVLARPFESDSLDDAEVLRGRADSWAGDSVQIGGDVDEDGETDLVIGAHQDGSADTPPGAFWVLPLDTGSADLAEVALRVAGEAQGDDAGLALAGVPGFGLAVGAPGSSEIADEAGAVYLVRTVAGDDAR